MVFKLADRWQAQPIAVKGNHFGQLIRRSRDPNLHDCLRRRIGLVHRRSRQGWGCSSKGALRDKSSPVHSNELTLCVLKTGPGSLPGQPVTESSSLSFPTKP